MAVILLVAMATVLTPGVMSLTQTEIDQFTARTYSEANTDLQGTVSIVTDGDYYRVSSNAIPDHSTGTFPGTGNPNSISSQSFSNRFAQTPSEASSVTCLPGGPIAFSINGIPIFNPYNIDGNNAVEGDTAEVFDDCDGHPDVSGTYHYHQTPDCLYNGGEDELVGVALDGFAIYGVKDSNGTDLTSADLDQCHGHTLNGTYVYRLTRDFPYVMGCFKGTPSPDIAARMFTASNCLIAGSTGSPTSTPNTFMLVLMLGVLYKLW